MCSGKSRQPVQNVLESLAGKPPAQAVSSVGANVRGAHVTDPSRTSNASVLGDNQPAPVTTGTEAPASTGEVSLGVDKKKQRKTVMGLGL
ncbi:hypothetical protein [Rhizobium phage RHEph15]|uniref:Uncharacterized protein n=2 Tax=Tepoztlanvirus TaxID=3424906 RepID=A0A7S5RA26_9CAUD|nr:hypothetical protein EVB35_032 [Rhizobium phage RHph_TM34]QIG68309.1 hypothetical protein EVB57_032 [Rhizobium phage RHph_Y1_20]QIG69978.1 hypothetical protein EVB84_034 [Rhizobium phage RHph_Y48]QIG70030.1 hypothetical protein EVB85_034 [Rhizobium phage RHph_Y86]QIG70082.1 hypothetical protein EVB86_034 [Rhizobium phage RHph_Y2_7]QXV74293.1 hypothetical protein [Rhizobium phage RHEph15]QXV74987.1 hypothetical protein [Rhizobium phage RHEph27]